MLWLQPRVFVTRPCLMRVLFFLVSPLPPPRSVLGISAALTSRPSLRLLRAFTAVAAFAWLDSGLSLKVICSDTCPAGLLKMLPDQSNSTRPSSASQFPPSASRGLGGPFSPRLSLLLSLFSCSVVSFPVLHRFLEFSQTNVH